ncbi:hypothetical protein PG985_011685 [Apiospora marii]|uniref:Uncharacterized protein n=1 Tax=Apiospora marii TaxID=335849 RepID=A0ABR1R0K1_9PEZI
MTDDVRPSCTGAEATSRLPRSSHPKGSWILHDAVALVWEIISGLPMRPDQALDPSRSEMERLDDLWREVRAELAVRYGRQSGPVLITEEDEEER